MNLQEADVNDVRALYTNNLKKAFDMEIKITKVLPKLVERSKDAELINAFRAHLDQTKAHVVAVESLLLWHVGEAATDTCKMFGELTASDAIKGVSETTVCDGALIGAAQQVEHHEIAVYENLRRCAEVLGLNDDAAILEAIEADETNAEALLNRISARVSGAAAA
jgi:ferritin-like metal-binding protein YciE